MASPALLHVMMLGKLVPVGLLIRQEYARAPAQRAHVIQCCQYRGSDELGSVGDAFHGLPQGFRNLERDDLLSLVFHELPSRVR